MLKPEENERICRVGAGTPMGELLRRYWLPALLSEEVRQNDGPPVRVRLLGEDLVAFRDSNGTVGLIDAYCTHRRAPMFFGRNEDCGLRCVYNGWKFSAGGSCVDMPSEPADSLFKSKVQITAYPTWEGGGMVWAYLGPPPQQPPAPDLEVCRAPGSARVVGKLFNECNYLQALEGAVDSVHSGILHCDDLQDKKQLRSRRCDVEFDVTPYGLAGAAIHPLDNGRLYARSFHFVMPTQSIRGLKYDRYGGKEQNPVITGQIYVPLDDESCWVYSYVYAAVPEAPPSAEFFSLVLRAWGCALEQQSEGFVHPRNTRNDYLIDRDLQRTTSFSGIVGMNVQDFAVQEGMGPICDRSKEHLAGSDQVIIAVRRLLFEGMDALCAGGHPRGTDPIDYRDVRGSDQILEHGGDWRSSLRDDLVARF